MLLIRPSGMTVFPKSRMICRTVLEICFLSTLTDRDQNAKASIRERLRYAIRTKMRTIFSIRFTEQMEPVTKRLALGCSDYQLENVAVSPLNQNERDN